MVVRIGELESSSLHLEHDQQDQDQDQVISKQPIVQSLSDAAQKRRSRQTMMMAIGESESGSESGSGSEESNDEDHEDKNDNNNNNNNNGDDDDDDDDDNTPSLSSTASYQSSARTTRELVLLQDFPIMENDDADADADAVTPSLQLSAELKPSQDEPATSASSPAAPATTATAPAHHHHHHHYPESSKSKSSGDTIINSKSKSNRNRNVTFHLVEIRNYSQTIGDNPAVSCGTPIQLDWDYEEFEPIGIDEYEANRGTRRTFRQLVLNYYHRRNLFTNKFGFSKQEIKKATNDANRIRNQRSCTKTFLSFMKVEECLESAGRKFNRVVRRSNRKGNNKRL